MKYPTTKYILSISLKATLLFTFVFTDITSVGLSRHSILSYSSLRPPALTIDPGSIGRLRSNLEKKPVVVTIDGPSAAGKTTAAKEVARRLGAEYIYYGKYYRLLTLFALAKKINLKDEMKGEDIKALADLAAQTDFSKLRIIHGTENRYSYDNKDITDAFFSQRVTDNVAYVAQVFEIRKVVAEDLKSIVEDKKAQGRSIVLEGRVTGVEIAPDADVKIFLTAVLDTRVERRARELIEKKGLKGVYCELFKISEADFNLLLKEKKEDIMKDEITEQIKKSIQSKDSRDQERGYMPATIALDAINIDSTDLTIEQVVHIIIDAIREKRPGSGYITPDSTKGQEGPSTGKPEKVRFDENTYQQIHTAA